MSQHRSLKNQLLFRLLPVLLVIWMLATAFISWRAWDEMKDSYTDQLGQIAHTLTTLLDARLLSPEGALESVAERRDRNFFVVVYAEGQPVLRSPNAPAEGDRTEFLTVESTAQNGTVHVIAGLERQELRSLLWDIVQGTAIPMALALLVMGAVLFAAVQRSLAPLKQLSQDLNLRDSRNLSPVDQTALPSEILPITAALNQLFLKLEGSMQRERQFVADASHELRTPLTAIRAQVETIDRSRLNPETDEALQHVNSAVKRATRLSRQLLSLARADAATAPIGGPIALDDAMRSITSDLFPHAVACNVEIAVEATDAQVNASLSDVEMLLGNLIENAILHGGGEVLVSCGTDDGRSWLSVEDNGPGIPKENHTQVFERFQRNAQQGVEGAGLGLSIVGAIAARLGAKIQLGRSQSLGGLCVCVEF